MNIGIITNLYPPYVRGGAEHVVVRTVEALTELGQDVFVISSQSRKEIGFGLSIDEQPTERIYRFFPMNIYFILRDFSYPWIVRLLWHFIDTFSFTGTWMVSRILDREEPDVVITHNLKGIGLRIASLIQKKDIPHVHVVHDLQLIYPSGLLYAGKEIIPIFARPFYSFYQFICKRRFGNPDIVIFPSTYLKKEYLSRGFFKDSEVLVMPNPAPRFSAVHRNPPEDDYLRLLFVGQLEYHKGIQFLLDAVRDMENVQIIIAGEGTYKQIVEKEADQNKSIVYLGYIALDQLVNCFGLCDALVVPSLCYENSPTVIYESYQAGVPVIASDIGGVGELVEDGKTGYLFKPGDLEDFKQTIEKLRTTRNSFLQEELKKKVEPYAPPIYGKQLLEKLYQLTKVDESKLPIVKGRDFLNKEVSVTIDRVIGSVHPIYNYIFPVNYGYIPETKAADKYEMDAYVLGVDGPVSTFSGRCIAYLERIEEDNDRLIVVPNGVEMTNEQIRDAVNFQEQFSPYKIVRCIIDGK